MLKKIISLLFLTSTLAATENPHLLCFGGGYFLGGSDHTGGLVQVEYRSNRIFWCYVRPKASVIVPEFSALFVGGGISVEIPTPFHVLFTPSFEPGLYYRGSSKNLGHVIEFRSTFDAAYEFSNKWRVGTQFYHISNASIGKHNPGANAWTVYVACPIHL